MGGWSVLRRGVWGLGCACVDDDDNSNDDDGNNVKMVIVMIIMVEMIENYKRKMKI